MDISNLSIAQLKAVAYDIKVGIEQGQANLRLIEDRMRLLNAQSAKEVEDRLNAPVNDPKGGSPANTEDAAQQNADQSEQSDEDKTDPEAK